MHVPSAQALLFEYMQEPASTACLTNACPESAIRQSQAQQKANVYTSLFNEMTSTFAYS